MLEFYTDEFKENASEEINIIKDKFINLLPKLYKWQMKGCIFENKYVLVYYMPILDEDKNQKGTKINLVDKSHNLDKYIITALNNSLKLRITTIIGVTKIYYVSYQDKVKTTEDIFMYDNDYVICIDTNDTYNIYSNIDDNDFLDKVYSIKEIDKLEEIEKIYFNYKKIVRKR